MRNFEQVCSGFLLAVIFASIGMVGTLYYDDRTYSGEEVFRSEADYQAFKEVVATDEVHLVSSQSLSSAPPIIVNFKVEAHRDYRFPYGKEQSWWYAAPLVLPIILVAGAMIWITKT